MAILNSLRPYAHWLLRLALAAVFFYHGFSKLPMAAAMADMMKMPIVMIYLIAAMEISGAALVLVGPLIKNDLATRVGGLFLSLIMLGAIGLVHKGQWNFMPSETHPVGGMEFQVTLLCVALYFVITGNRQSTTE